MVRSHLAQKYHLSLFVQILVIFQLTIDFSISLIILNLTNNVPNIPLYTIVAMHRKYSLMINFLTTIVSIDIVLWEGVKYIQRGLVT